MYNYVTDEYADKSEALCNLGDGKSEKEALEEMFGDDEHVILVEGIDQSKTTVIENNGSWYQIYIGVKLC